MQSGCVNIALLVIRVGARNEDSQRRYIKIRTLCKK